MFVEVFRPAQHDFYADFFVWLFLSAQNAENLKKSAKKHFYSFFAILGPCSFEITKTELTWIYVKKHVFGYFSKIGHFSLIRWKGVGGGSKISPDFFYVKGYHLGRLERKSNPWPNSPLIRPDPLSNSKFKGEVLG